MNFTIDTENKTISFDTSVNLSELVSQLKKMLPNDWKEYELISVTYSYPTIAYPNYPVIQPYYYDGTITTCGTTSTNVLSPHFTLTTTS